MRARYLRPGYFKNEFLGSMEPHARLLFAGLWCEADREGRLEDRPRRLKAEILGYDDVTAKQVDGWLDELAHQGFIVRYVGEDGQRYIAIRKFAEHQHPHKNEAASVIPPPNDASQEQKSRTMARLKPDHGTTSDAPRNGHAPANVGPAPDHGTYDSGSLLVTSYSLLEDVTGPGHPGAGAHTHEAAQDADADDFLASARDDDVPGVTEPPQEIDPVPFGTGVLPGAEADEPRAMAKLVALDEKAARKGERPADARELEDLQHVWVPRFRELSRLDIFARTWKHALNRKNDEGEPIRLSKRTIESWLQRDYNALKAGELSPDVVSEAQRGSGPLSLHGTPHDPYAAIEIRAVAS